MRLILQAATIAAFTITTTAAFAQSECELDTDCAEGVCVKVTTDCPPPCPPDSVDCEPSDCVSETFGKCVGSDNGCTSADDCDIGKICVQLEGSTCDCDPNDSTCGCVNESVGVCVPPPPPDCESDADCDAGLICKAVGIAPCPPCDPNDSACVPGDCPVDEVKKCVPAPPPPCEVDADCTDTEVCLDEVHVVCDDGFAPCDPNDPACDLPPPDACHEETARFCRPQYEGGCTQDADCGPGFTCDVDGSKCLLVETSCSQGAPCDEGLVCVQPPDGDCSVDSAGNVSCPPPDPNAPGFCAPPGFEPGEDEGGDNTGGGDGSGNEIDADGNGSNNDVTANGNGSNNNVNISCASSAGMAPWAAALALLMLRRRRRA